MNELNLTESLRIRCSAEWKHGVEQAAKLNQEGVSNLVRRAVNEYLDATSQGWAAQRVERVILSQVQAKIQPSKPGRRR